MAPSFDTISTFLDDHGLDWWYGADGTWIFVACQVAQTEARLGVTMEGAMFHIQLFLHALVIPPHALPALAVAVCRINHSLPLPGFYIDFDAGLLSFRISLPADATDLSSESFKAFLATCVSTAEAHWTAFAEVIASTRPDGDHPLHTAHPVFGTPALAQPRYAEVRAYLSSRDHGETPRPPLPGAWPAERGPKHLHPFMMSGDGALIWNPMSGDMVALVLASRLHLWDGAAWQPEDPTAFQKGLSQHSARLLATYRLDEAKPGLASTLEHLGFAEPYEEVVVERPLAEGLPSAEVSLRWSTQPTPPMDLLGSVAQDSPNRALAGLDVADLVLTIDAAPHAEPHWHLAHHGEQPVGLVRLCLPDEQGYAGLAFIGVLPLCRGKGFGRALHAWALHELARLGAQHYHDATDTENTAMRRVFLSHECQVVATICHLRRTS